MLKYYELGPKRTTIPPLALIAALAMALAAPAAAMAQFSMEDDAGIPAPPPAAAPGQATVDEGIEGPGAPPWAIVPEDPTVGHVATVNELMDAHKDLTGIMEAQSGGDYSTPDYPFVMTYVDEENEELVVMMHTMAALAGIEYEEREIQVALDTEADIKITYGTVELDATPVQVESWKQYYRANCLPSYKPGYQTACILYEGYLRENGVDPSSLGTPSTPTPTLSTADPCAQSRSSLACYYYTQYKSRCLPTASTSRCSTYATQITTAGYALPTAPNPAPAPNPNPAPAPQPLNPAPVPVSGATVFSDGFESGLAAKWVETGEFDWRADSPDEGNPPSRPSSNRVAEADDCDTGCVLTMRSFLNLSGHASATLEFWRYIDTSLDVNEYLRVQVHSSGRWTTVYSWGGGIGDDDRWHKEAYSLNSHLTNDFKVRFVAKMSTAAEEVAIDDVAVRGTLRASSDTVPPVVTVPADITRTAPSSAGVAVTYTASARDAVDGAIAPTCLPASGSTFRVGTTTVRCTATDAARNTGSASFRVTVDTADTTAPVLSLPAGMTVAAASAAGANVSYTASARDAVDGSVAPSCWPRSGDRFFVGETTVTCRAWDSSRNQARASFTVTVTPFAPAPAPGAVVLSEGFEGGLSRWVESGEPDWRAGRHEWYYNPDGTSTSGTANDVAKADDCDTGCTLTLARPVDLSGYAGATLTLSRFVDRSLDSGEYLRVQAHKGGSWTTIWSWTQGSGDDGAWHHESRSLSSHLVSDFKVRLVARMSSSSEDVGVDNVEVRATGGARPADTAAPVVTVPAGISRASATAVAVTYAASARDAVDGAITPACSPASGSAFAVGTTTVTCEATDNAGNTGSASFTVTVTAPDTAAPVMTAPSAMSFTATSAAGAVVSYTVTALDAVDGEIAPSCEPASGTTFAVGSTTVSCTATDSAGNTGSASFTVTVTPAPAPANQCPAPGPSGAPGSSSPPACPGASTPAPTTVFEDDFESGLSKWREASNVNVMTGAPIYGSTNWRSGIPDDANRPDHPPSNKVAKTDDCDSFCGLETRTPIDLSGYATASLEFWVYVDNSLASGENLSLAIHKNGSWTSTHSWTSRSDHHGSWHKVTYNLADYRVSDFKVRFEARADGVDKDLAIDDVAIKGMTNVVDTTPPVITSPDSFSVMTASATSSTATVSFPVSAYDNVDGSVPVTCSPALGTVFSLGSTSVSCSATDSAKNKSPSATVTVTVSKPPTGSASTVRGGTHLLIGLYSIRADPPIDYGNATSGIVLNHNGAKSVLLTSHSVDLPDEAGRTFHRMVLNNPSGSDPFIGRAVAATTNVRTNALVSSDAALVPITGTVPSEVGKIKNGTGVVPVASYGGVGSLKEGDEVEVFGAFTNSVGALISDNVAFVHIGESTRTTHTNHAAASYFSKNGDSGAPVIHTNSSGKSQLLGIHSANAKYFLHDPSGTYTHQRSPGGSTDVSSAPPQFGLFSTWEQITDDLGLS